MALLFSLAEIKGAKTMKSKIKQLAEDQRRSSRARGYKKGTRGTERKRRETTWEENESETYARGREREGQNKRERSMDEQSADQVNE